MWRGWRGGVKQMVHLCWGGVSSMYGGRGCVMGSMGKSPCIHIKVHGVSHTHIPYARYTTCIHIHIYIHVVVKCTKSHGRWLS